MVVILDILIGFMAFLFLLLLSASVVFLMVLKRMRELEFGKTIYRRALNEKKHYIP